MAPVKGPSVLHLFVHHRLLHMMMHVHMMMRVVMHHWLIHRLLHGLVLSHCRCRDRNRGQRRQYVGNLLHCSLLGVEFTPMERKDDQSVPLTLKKIYEPLFRFVLADRLAREAGCESGLHPTADISLRRNN